MPIGFLQVQAVTSRAEVPVVGATVSVTGEAPGGGRELLSLQRTDESGMTDAVSVSTPDRDNSLSPNQGKGWTDVTVTVSHPDYDGIVVNTVQCGTDSSTTPIWREIALLTDGGYSQIGQTGDMRMIETPFDAEIQRINMELGKTVLPYGSVPAQSVMRGLVTDNVGASAYVAGARNAVKAKVVAESALAAPVAGMDLTAEPELLDKLRAEDMPEEFRTLSAEERKAKLDEAVSQRRELNAQLLELDRKRSAYLREVAERQSTDAAPSFDEEVLKSIDGQLKRLESSAK